MNSKIIIQILLIVTVITILSATFYNYFYDDAITSTVTKSEDLIKKITAQIQTLLRFKITLQIY